MVSCHVERPLDDRVWAAFAELQEQRPGGLSIAALHAQAAAEEALSAATRKGDAAAVKKLLDEGVDVNTKYRYNRTALSFAADRGHVDVVKVLLERGADVNAKDTFYGATALLWAIRPAMELTPRHEELNQ